MASIPESEYPFCEELYALIKHIAKGRIRDLEEQQEVIQYTAVGVLSQREKLMVWEDNRRYGFIRNAVRNNHWRIRKPYHRELPLVNPEDVPSEADDPYKKYVENRLKEELKDMASEVLTKMQLDIFELRLEGYSFKVIAEMTKRSAGACRGSWVDIQRKLAKAARERGWL